MGYLLKSLPIELGTHESIEISEMSHWIEISEMSHCCCCWLGAVWALWSCFHVTGALWSCFHVAGDAVGSSALAQGCSVGWNERRRLPRLQLASFCLPVKAKPKVKVNGQGCDCHLRWAGETLSWPFLSITNPWTSAELAWWLISSATETMAAAVLCF